MAKVSANKYDYSSLSAAIKDGRIMNCYIFHGDERYLLEHSLAQLRAKLCPDGLGGFNYKRFDGKTVTVEELEGAVDTLPVFAEKTLIEVFDMDIFGGETETLSKSGSGPDDKLRNLTGILSDLPEYVCLVFVYYAAEFKPDARRKITSELLKHVNIVHFTVQEEDKLIKWITRHFNDAGKDISAADAGYLSFITDGLMHSLQGEIEKVAAYASDRIVTRSDIDSVVTPVLDAVVYKMTDALMRREYSKTMVILDELLRMQEAPHKLMYSISLKMRQLLAARVCLDNGLGTSELMTICGIYKNNEFQASSLLETAGKTTLTECRNAVLLCSETGFELNSMPDPEVRLVELLVKLAFPTSD